MPRRRGDASEGLRVYGPAALLVLVAFGIGLYFVKPAPPTRLVMATGSPAGAYHAFGERYAELLAAEGITLELRNTAGSVENIGLLASGAVEVALVQGGTVPEGMDGGLHSLGSVFFEPLWLFHRAGLALDRLPALAGRRVAVGAPGSGTRVLVERLLTDNGVRDTAVMLPLSGTEAVDALAAGEVDAVFLVTSADSGLVARLLREPGVELASLERAHAYARRYRYLSSLTLPEGAIDLAANVPPREVRLLAPAANLVGSAELHPALVNLLLQAAERVHGSGGWFEAPGQFPANAYLELPLGEEAARYYRFGPPFLQRYLPFWAASLLDRLKVMLLPLLVLMFPLFKIMPPLYQWRMRARVYRWYRELEAVDDVADAIDSETRRGELLAELERIEHDVREVKVPLSFTGQLYHLREHIHLVRQRLLADATTTSDDRNTAV